MRNGPRLLSEIAASALKTPSQKEPRCSPLSKHNPLAFIRAGMLLLSPDLRINPLF